MSTAAADITLQRLHDFFFGWIVILFEQRHAADDHSGGAIRALKRGLVEKRSLHGMEEPILLESFNGDDRLASRVTHGKLAGAPRRAVQQNRACAALAFAATVLGSSQPQLFAQCVEQTGGRIRLENPSFSVDLRLDEAGHSIPLLGG